MIQAAQDISTCFGDTVQIAGTNVEDMTGWTMSATVYDTNGNILSSGSSISTVTTLAVLSFTAGWTKTLAAGTYYVEWVRTDSGQEATLAVIRWIVTDRSKPWLTG